MNMHTLLTLRGLSGWTLAVAVGVLPMWASAQTPAPAAASAPAPLNQRLPPLKPAPRALSPEQKRDVATVPGDVRPADKVIPQINVPIGRTPPPKLPSRAEARRQRQTQAQGGVDDGVARCKAEATAAARRECLDLQSRVGKKP